MSVSGCGLKMAGLLVRYAVIVLGIILSFVAVQISGDGTTALGPKLEADLIMAGYIGDLPPKARESFHQRGCNLLYHSILHVRLCQLLELNELAKYVKTHADHYWARKMLVVMSHSRQTAAMMWPMWVFYFYTYKVENNMACYQQTESNAFELESMHNATFEVLRNGLQSVCPDLGTIDKPESRVYESYIADITEENDPSKLEKNVKTSTPFTAYEMYRNSILSRRDVYLRMDKLHLNDVFGNGDIMDTLITKFGLIPKDNNLKTFFHTGYKTFLDSKSLLQNIKALYDVEFHFVSMLKIMMLRLCLNHLMHVQRLWNINHRYRSYYLLINKKFQEFTKLLGLTSDVEVKRFSDLLNSTRNDKHKSIAKIHANGMDVLKTVCEPFSGVVSCNDTDSMELSRSTLKSIAKSNGLSTGIGRYEGLFMKRHNVYNTILCANIFIDYLRVNVTSDKLFFVSFFVHSLCKTFM